jgi:hypothetical protein
LHHGLWRWLLPVLLRLRITTLLRSYTLSTTTKELHLVSDNLCSIVLNAIALPLSATQTTLNIQL